MKALALLVVAAVAGCATPTTGVIPLSEGFAKVSHQGNGAWVATSDLKTKAIQEAAAWCEAKKKTIRVVDTKETQARPFGGWPEAEVLFKCE